MARWTMEEVRTLVKGAKSSWLTQLNPHLREFLDDGRPPDWELTDLRSLESTRTELVESLKATIAMYERRGELHSAAFERKTLASAQARLVETKLEIGQLLKDYEEMGVPYSPALAQEASHNNGTT